MGSRDLVSARLETIFASLGFGLEGFRSRDWILQRNVLIQFYNSTTFLFVVFAGKKQPKHVGKMPEIWKNSSQKRWRHFKEIFRQNAQILKSRVSLSNFKSRVSEFLMKSRSRSRRLRSRLHHWKWACVILLKVGTKTIYQDFFAC